MESWQLIREGKNPKEKSFHFPPFLAFLHPGNQKLSERERKRQEKERKRGVIIKRKRGNKEGKREKEEE